LLIQTAQGTDEFRVLLKKTHLTYGIAEGALALMRRAPAHRWILFAPYVGPRMGEFLTDNDACYVDEVGNCRLAMDGTYIALIEGRKPTRKTRRGRGMRAPGHQILFAILAEPDLLNAPVRRLADAAGVGKTAAANTLAALEDDGLIGRGVTKRHALARREILDRWLAGYAAMVRPRLMVGRFRTLDPDIDGLEHRIEDLLGDTVTWAWGGGAAAMRLTGQYRGEETVLHVEQAPQDLAAKLRALPAADGPLTVLGAPGKVAYKGAIPKTVHPFLVYTELVTLPDQRARQAADAVLTDFLPALA
jgi:hypothetical protein